MYRNSNCIHPCEPSRATAIFGWSSAWSMSQLIWSVLKNSHFLHCVQKKLMVFLQAANSRTSLQLYCLHIFCAYGMTELWGHAGLFQYWVVSCCGWLACHIIKIMCDSPLLQWEPKDNKNVVFVVSVNFCGAVGKQQDLYSFQLIAALRDSAKKYVPKICLSQITNCSLSFVYVD